MPLPEKVLIGGEVFRSYSAAARRFGVTPNTIIRHLDDGTQETLLHYDKELANGQRRVKHLPTGKVWQTIKDAAKEFGVNPKTMSRRCEVGETFAFLNERYGHKKKAR